MNTRAAQNKRRVLEAFDTLFKDGMLVEHWDVIQDEATREESKSKAPMFGTSFPRYPDRTSPA